MSKDAFKNSHNPCIASDAYMGTKYVYLTYIPKYTSCSCQFSYALALLIISHIHHLTVLCVMCNKKVVRWVWITWWCRVTGSYAKWCVAVEDKEKQFKMVFRISRVILLDEKHKCQEIWQTDLKTQGDFLTEIYGSFWM